ncbi:MAG: hypothetical protein WCG26_10275, partial [Chloroflexales bacterium]
PDCLRDPEHASPGGVRPISEFRLFTGKAAKRYKDGRRWSTYCRYHERLRGKLRREALKAAGKRPTPLTPEQRKRYRRTHRGRLTYDRARMAARLAHQRETAPDAPPELVALRQRRLAHRRQWAIATEQKVRQANWRRERLAREIAAGLRPPLDLQRKRGRPRTHPKDILLAVQGRSTMVSGLAPDTLAKYYAIWHDHGLPTATKVWTWPAVRDEQPQEQVARDALATYAANDLSDAA